MKKMQKKINLIFFIEILIFCVDSHNHLTQIKAIIILVALVKVET